MSSYKDTLARTALVYLIQTGIIALASFLLSFVVLNGIKLSALVDLAVLLLFVKDIEDLPEKTPKTKLALKRIGQALVLCGLSLLLQDTPGGIVYGLTALFPRTKFVRKVWRLVRKSTQLEKITLPLGHTENIASTLVCTQLVNGDSNEYRPKVRSPYPKQAPR